MWFSSRDKMGRKGYGIELSPDYFRDGAGYTASAEAAPEKAGTVRDFTGNRRNIGG